LVSVYGPNQAFGLYRLAGTTKEPSALRAWKKSIAGSNMLT